MKVQVLDGRWYMTVNHKALDKLSWYWSNDQVQQRIEKNSHVKKIRADLKKERAKHLNRARRLIRA